MLRELRRECSRGACINARHAEDALRIVELLPIQVQYWNLHRTRGFAFLAVRAFDGVAVHSEKAVLLENCHDASNGANVPTPESGDSPCRVDESDEYENVDPCECRYAA